MSVVLENVCYTYMKGTPYERCALDRVSLSIEKGEFVALIGHSGSGKSTLVQQLSGLLQPSSGRVLVDGVDLSGKGDAAKAARRKVGLVFQYPEHQLFAETVFDDVAFGPRNLGLSEDEVALRVAEALAFVRLPLSEFATRSPFALSGGQMRRVAIAGVVAMRPDYLILDEPSAGLDPLARNILYEEMRLLYEKSAIAIVLVTHSMEEAVEFSKRLLVMSNSKIILDDQPVEIFKGSQAVLREAGVDVPDIVRLADCLRHRGFRIDEDCLSVEMLVAELLEGLKQRGRA